MLTILPAIGTKEIATLLQVRREEERRVVLFLGSRTSGWMRNPIFYDNVGMFGNSEFYRLDSVGKFGRCHKILSDGRRFKETDVHQILVTALNGLKRREEDDWLVELIKEDLFDVILSTSIDDFVETACLRAGMEEEREFHVLHPLRNNGHNLIWQESEALTIVKVFGDLGTRSYATAGKELNFVTQPVLRELLTALLAKEVLIVGYDPIWDRAVEEIFPANGEVLYYVNEQELADNAPLYQKLLQRRGRYCVGSHNSYKGFMKTLRRSFFSHHMLPWASTSPSRSQESVISRQGRASPSPAPQEVVVSKGERKTVFISYSHEDKRFLDELLPHLDIYEQRGILDVWCDRNIGVGEDWRGKIEDALNTAEVAILLISKYFLASKFIKNVELPHLLEAAKQRGLEIIPVVLSPCVFGDSPLHQFQTINSPDRPVSKSRRKLDRDVIWVDVAKKVKKLIQ